METTLAIGVAAALIIGVFLGMLGGGGSVLLVPVLLYVLKLPPKAALATSQLVMAGTTVIAMLLHARAGRVVFAVGLVFGISGMTGSFLGGRLAHHLPSQLLLTGFIVLMVVSAVQMLRKKRTVTSLAGQGGVGVGVEPSSHGLWLGAAVGFPTGLVTGLLGAGGGFLVVPALTLFGRLSIEKAVGTSLLVIAMQSFAGSLGYLGHATVDLRLVGLLIAAMGTSSLLGGLLSQRVPAALLRKLFAGLLLAVACLMFGRTFL